MSFRMTLLLCFCLSLSALAKEPAKKASTKVHDETTVSKSYQFNQGKHKFPYKVTTGTIFLRDEKEEPSAEVFYIAYTRTDVDNQSKRPITFSFNGGPGSSSVWLHLGTLAPKRVNLTDEGWAPKPPFKLIDNEGTIFGETDLVFIDPVSTGFSRPLNETSPKEFHGLREDVQTVGEFIRLYTTRNARWNSPKFMIGESYGTTRAAALVNHMQRRHGMYFNGVMLVSAVLDFHTNDFDEGNDLPHITHLPTYAATAWYHKKSGGDLASKKLEDVVEAARQFALGDYAKALLLGDLMPESERKKVITRYAQFIGLSEAFVTRHNLRVQARLYFSELKKAEMEMVGRLDSRFTSPNPSQGSFNFMGDPSYSAILGPYTSTLLDFLTNEIGYKSDRLYEIIANVRNWNWSAENRYVNVAPQLRTALIQNPHLKIYIANGYYDIATPFFATEHTFNHLNLTKEQKNNISWGYFPSGHMMYIHRPSLIKFGDDLIKFIKDAK